MPDVLRVRGLSEVTRAFRQVDKSLNKELVRGFKDVARHVVDVARRKMEFGPGEAMSSIKPRATQKGAGIARPEGGRPWKGEKADYYPWLEWGGSTGRGHKDRVGGSGAIQRPFVGHDGRYLYPAIGESKEFIRQAVDEDVERVVKRAGFTTTGHV